VGPCQGAGCYVARQSAYSQSCDKSGDGTPIAAALERLCENDGSPFTDQSCTGETRASECAVNLIGNGGERASFFRVMNSIDSDSGRNTDTEGLFFYDSAGRELLHIRPNGPEFQGRADYNHFAAVPDATAYVFLKGGGSDAGDDYSGMAVSFFTCSDTVQAGPDKLSSKSVPCLVSDIATPSTIACQNGGQATGATNSCACDCTGTGYEGELCEIKSPPRYIKVWQGTGRPGVCGWSTSPTNCHIGNHSGNLGSCYQNGKVGYCEIKDDGTACGFTAAQVASHAETQTGYSHSGTCGMDRVAVDGPSNSQYAPDLSEGNIGFLSEAS